MNVLPYLFIGWMAIASSPSSLDLFLSFASTSVAGGETSSSASRSPFLTTTQADRQKGSNPLLLIENEKYCCSHSPAVWSSCSSIVAAGPVAKEPASSTRALLAKVELGLSFNDALYVPEVRPLPIELERADKTVLKPPPVNDDLPVIGTKVWLHKGGEGYSAVVLGMDQWGRAVVENSQGERELILDEAVQRELAAQPQYFSLTRLPSDQLYKAPQAFVELVNYFLKRPIVADKSSIDYMNYLRRHGYEVYLTGGAVRDLLHLVVHHPEVKGEEASRFFNDMDLRASCTPLFVQKMFEEMHRGDVAIHLRTLPQYGISRLLNDDGSPGIDINSMRRGYFPEELYQTLAQAATADVPSSPKLEAPFGHDLTKDGETLDFCSNALYYDPFNEVLIDPTGLGLHDAIFHLLRFTGGAQLTSDLLRTRAGSDLELFKRFWKFRMRGYASNAFTTRIMLYRFEQVWKSALERSQDRELLTAQELSNELEPLYFEIWHLLPSHDLKSEGAARDLLHRFKSVVERDMEIASLESSLPSFLQQQEEAMVDYFLHRFPHRRGGH